MQIVLQEALLHACICTNRSGFLQNHNLYTKNTKEDKFRLFTLLDGGIRPMIHYKKRNCSTRKEGIFWNSNEQKRILRSSGKP